MVPTRFDRQILFLTAGGQRRIASTRIVVVGIGGLGSHLVQQLAYLGAVNLVLIDPDCVEESNLNRLVTAFPSDVGVYKVVVLGHFIRRLHGDACPQEIPKDLATYESFEAIKAADVLVGCLDDDGPRFLLNQLAAAYSKTYLDLASEIGEDRTSFGGRVSFVRPGKGCLWCRGTIDEREVRAWLETPADRRMRDRVYGQRVDEGAPGPSVVALNGVVASLGVMELMVELAGVRRAYDELTYRGPHGVVTRSLEKQNDAKSCRVCQEVAGSGDAEDLERFIRQKLSSQST